MELHSPHFTWIYKNIYVGDRHSPAALLGDGPGGNARTSAAPRWAVLNVARDLDIMEPKTAEAYQLGFEYHKVGLVDGPGNLPSTLAAAVFAVHQLRSPCRPIIAQGDGVLEALPDNILVHCHAGRSRSVAVVGAYLHACYPRSFETVEVAAAMILDRRELTLTKGAEVLIELASRRETSRLLRLGLAVGRE